MRRLGQRPQALACVLVAVVVEEHDGADSTGAGGVVRGVVHDDPARDARRRLYPSEALMSVPAESNT